MVIYTYLWLLHKYARDSILQDKVDTNLNKFHISSIDSVFI